MAGAAPRYARAFYEALVAAGSFEATLPTIRSLAVLPDDLIAALGNPATPIASRESALRVAVGNPGADTILGRFVALLGARRRLDLVKAIAAEVVAIQESKAGIVRGTVVSRTPLPGSAISTLSRSLSSEGRHVELDVRTDATILGGFRVILGDVLLDATANNQLNQARRALLSA